jgi:hypothetical protein
VNLPKTLVQNHGQRGVIMQPSLFRLLHTRFSAVKSDVWVNRNFGWYFVGQAFSTLGDNMHFIAVMMYIYKITQSATALSGLWLAFSLPIILIGPLAGTLLDRYIPVRKTMITADLLRAMLQIQYSLQDRSSSRLRS